MVIGNSEREPVLPRHRDAVIDFPGSRRWWWILVLGELVVVPIGLVTLFYLLVEALPLVKLRDAAGAVAASFVFALAAYALFALRLGLVLEAFRLSLPRASVWRIHLSSLFYYFFLPAGIGYDLSKGAKIAYRAPQAAKRRIAAAIVAERGVGGLGLGVLLLATVPFIEPTADSRLAALMSSPWAWGAPIAAALLAGGLVAVYGRRAGTCHPGPLLPAIGVSAIAHLIIAGAIVFVAVSLGIPVSLPEVIVALTATLLLQLVPVNLLGVTLGEIAAVTVYLGFGLAKPEALLLATVAYTHRLIAAIVGGAVEAVGAWLALRRGRTGGTPTDQGVAAR